MNYRIAKAAALPLFLLLPLGAQDKDKKNKTAAPYEGITREQGDQILEELRQIRQLLEKQNAVQAKAAEPPAPVKAKLNLTGAQMMGAKNAPVTMVEFTDYQCPYCQRFHLQVFNELKKDFIDTGKVRFYSKDLPLDSLHPNATRAAQAARCAADQGTDQFWKLRDIMGSHPEGLDLSSLVADAAQLHMNTDSFKTCVETGKYKDAVQSDYLEAMRIGADGTPAFVIGKSTTDGVDGELLVGAMPLPIFEKRFGDLGVAK
jgi:protein-disulfide isomerase